MEQKSDHDLLIELNTKFDVFQQIIIRHLEDDSQFQGKIDIKINTIDNKISTVHRRVDGLQVTGILTIIGFIVTVTLAVFLQR